MKKLRISWRYCLRIGKKLEWILRNWNRSLGECFDVIAFI